MATEVAPRKSKKRPVGVYAPPHLREEQSENAQHEECAGKPVSECLDPNLQGNSAKQDNRKGQRSRNTPKQTLEKDVFAAEEQQCVTAEFEAGEPSSSKLFDLERSDWLQGANDPSANFWTDSARNEEAMQKRTPVVRFERASLAEGWLQWLERLVSSADIQMDAVVALYLDGLLKVSGWVCFIDECAQTNNRCQALVYGVQLPRL